MNTRLVLLLAMALFFVWIGVDFLRRKKQRDAMKQITPEVGDLNDLEKDAQLDLLNDDPLFNDAPNWDEVTATASAEPEQTPTDGAIIFYLMAKDKSTYSGYELLQTLLDVGLQSNKMGIFDARDEQGRLLFSVLSAENPGCFDLHDLGALTCPGLCFLLALEQQNVSEAYQAMLKAIMQLEESLNGDILTDRREVCTGNYLEYCLQKVKGVQQIDQALHEEIMEV